jgi:hypothetical protein
MILMVSMILILNIRNYDTSTIKLTFLFFKTDLGYFLGILKAAKSKVRTSHYSRNQNSPSVNFDSKRNFCQAVTAGSLEPVLIVGNCNGAGSKGIINVSLKSKKC